MRAPNHPQSCMLSETAVDDLAAKLDLDPVQVRLKNLPPGDPNSKDPISWNALRNKIYTDEIDIAMKLSGWKQKWHPPGKGPDKGGLKRGIGMALHTWGGNAAGPNECKITISRSGSVSAESSTQDLGTGQRTVTAVVTAEILGLEPADIHVKIGESQLGNSSGSGGSTTCPSQAPDTEIEATAARDDPVTKVDEKLKINKADLGIEKGKVVDKNGKSWSWKEFCAKLGSENARGQGEWSQARAMEADDNGK